MGDKQEGWTEVNTKETECVCVCDSAVLLQCREYKGGGGTCVCQRALASMTNPAVIEPGLKNYNVW